jgi:hypothetical protein
MYRVYGLGTLVEVALLVVLCIDYDTTEEQIKE